MLEIAPDYNNFRRRVCDLAHRSQSAAAGFTGSFEIVAAEQPGVVS